jgi:hypothetical protein
VSAPAPLLPRSRRETFALICLGQLLWLLAILTLAGVSPWSTGTLIALGAGGAVGILAAGVLYARRFRH